MNTPQINNGGQAFPCITIDDSFDSYKQTFHSGMSLRDWFAGQALAGLLAQPVEPQYGLGCFAKSAYLMADEMLKTREVKP
jgi:hypothetical protein